MSSSSSSAFIPTHQALNVRIDDRWIDLGRWRSNHPSGDHWLDLMKDKDATEVFHAFHSPEATSQMLRMPVSKDAARLEAITPKVTPLTRSFRALRARLEAEGWWERDYKHEARLLAVWFSVLAGGVVAASSAVHWVRYGVGMMLLSLAFTASGWLGHDYIHGRDKFSSTLRNFGALFSGLSPLWWSDKHNKHHAVTNFKGVDEDLATEPLLYVHEPDPSKDVATRRFQHIYFPLPLSMLFAVWRVGSIKVLIEDMFSGFKRKTQSELLCLGLHYSLVGLFIPWTVFLSSVFVSGLMTAIIVTVTHQSEELFDEYQDCFVSAQFRSTRDVVCRNVFSDWLWGGMQYQLEHHLFPSMPRSKYPALSAVLKQFAKDNGIEYRVSDEFEIIRMNWETYRKHAFSQAVVGQRHYEPEHWGGKREAVDAALPLA